MEEERVRDFRVPLISGLFFLLCIFGGVLLVMWLFDADGSQPWFPILALVLISFPWIFWFLIYIYTLLKTCFRRSGGGKGGGDSKCGGSHAPPAVATTENWASAKESPVNSPTGKKQVQFGAAVVMEDNSNSGKNGQHDGTGELSVASSKECEMPLTLSVSS